MNKLHPLVYAQLGLRSKRLLERPQARYSVRFRANSNLGYNFSSFASLRPEEKDLFFYSNLTSGFKIKENVEITTSVTSQKQLITKLSFSDLLDGVLNAGIFTDMFKKSLYGYFSCCPKYGTMSFMSDFRTRVGSFSMTTDIKGVYFGMMGNIDLAKRSFPVLETAMQYKINKNTEIVTRFKPKTKIVSSEVFSQINPRIALSLGLSVDCSERSLDLFQAAVLVNTSPRTQLYSKIQSSGKLSLQVLTKITDHVSAGVTGALDLSKLRQKKNPFDAKNFGIALEINTQKEHKKANFFLEN
ncbi:hypothetical protein M0813_07176 [Anaeramoeba flamelloides]|uniref:Uncharacterized protein n=1 Tax=Anaeramoeba flamelloides TaxID=1746091 RepID=A0ABQ8XCU0_9EUKA|nr:hypothetical protein M0813_07176 [Anaeramoeba flamelloides]